MPKPKTPTNAAIASIRREDARARKAKRAARGVAEPEHDSGAYERRYQSMIEHKPGQKQTHFGFVPDRPAPAKKQRKSKSPKLAQVSP